MEGRLRKYGYLPTARQVVDLSKPFSQRVVSPLVNKLGGLVVSVAPERLQGRAKEKLEQARVNISPNTFIAIRVAVGAVLAFLIVSSLARGPFGIRQFFLALVFFVLGTRLPDFWLSRRISQRQHRIQKSLPDALDLITICVEAGYGLDAALAKVAEKTRGPLADELAQALMEVNLGKHRSQALRDMAQRTKVADLQAFVATIIQAEQMGVSIADILRIQADSMRVKKRQRVEEEAMKAPVKMLFPLILLILPAMFVVLLGPAVMKIASFFGSGMKI